MATTHRQGIRSSRWFRLVWIAPLAVVVVLIVVFGARWLRDQPGVQSFMTTYPGATDLPSWAPVGFPAWVAWQHFLNAFFIVLIIRSGWLVRTTQRPAAYFTRNNTGVIRTKGRPKKISLDLWMHLCLDALWVANGLIFIVLIFVTGQWVRIVPTSWGIFPNAVSTGIQYASLQWPTEDGWVDYNALQVLSYFAVVFLAAPLAIVTGLRMSGAWPAQARINRVYPIELARAVHYPVMLFFVIFVIVHVVLVLATGALRNLNHMYGGSDEVNWVGFWIFVVSIVVIAAAWIAARPIVLRPIAGLMGKVGR
ncbi:MAG: transporter [Subtercola sp.]|nr:transporter [Subtercola sp.]